MLVSNLQQFLVLLLPPLRAAGLNATADKSVTSSLEAMATALDPFKDLSIEQVADLLKVTQEYRHTGQIPDWVLARKPPASKARKSTPKTPKAPKPPKMTPDEAIGKLRDCEADRRTWSSSRSRKSLWDLESLTVPQAEDGSEGISRSYQREE